jgi:phosphatidylglycerophosphatase A
LKLWIAQGFGLGRIPFAPGTFGSFAGLLWFALLLWPGNLRFYLLGTAESILHRTDPPSVVLDEIIAIPVCFTGWVVWVLFQSHAMPSLEFFFIRNWLPTLGVIGVFRLFDVIKPWPVRQSQNLPGGWGVTVDDILAAVYVNAAVLSVLFFTRTI